jgi:hypothetical protein
MLIYYFSSDKTNKDEKKACLDFQKDYPEFVFGVFNTSNISIKINECFSLIYHEKVKDGPRRPRPVTKDSRKTGNFIKTGMTWNKLFRKILNESNVEIKILRF